MRTLPEDQEERDNQDRRDQYGDPPRETDRRRLRRGLLRRRGPLYRLRRLCRCASDRLCDRVPVSIRI